MADQLNLPFPLRIDGAWVRCPDCTRGYWGLFRPTAFITGKYAAHCKKAHPQAQAEAAADAASPAPRQGQAHSDHADFVPNIIRKVAARQAANANGPCKVVREAGPHTPLNDPLADIAAELDPRLQLGQGPRMFPDEGGARARKAKRTHKGQDVMAEVAVNLSPLAGWA